MSSLLHKVAGVASTKTMLSVRSKLPAKYFWLFDMDTLNSWTGEGRLSTIKGLLLGLLFVILIVFHCFLPCLSAWCQDSFPAITLSQQISFPLWKIHTCSPLWIQLPLCISSLLYLYKPQLTNVDPQVGTSLQPYSAGRSYRR